MNVFSRPLFKNQFIRRYAEGGIVSTVADGQPQVDPTAMLQDFAGQVEATESNIDSANSMDELLSSFSGEEKTVEGAREELAEFVGAKDAMATPESVLALVQPAMEIMKMSQQMAPAGGIGDVPLPGAQAPMMGVQTPEGFTPAQMQAEPFQPQAAFKLGGLAEYVQDYKSARNDPALAGLGYDEGDYWTALGLLGAGLAQGKTVAQGLSLGTQMYAPYLQDVRKSERAEKLSALDYALKARTADEEAAAAAAAADLKHAREKEIEQMKLDAASLKPTEAQRNAMFIAETEGLTPGSPAYNSRVSQIMLREKASIPDKIEIAQFRLDNLGLKPGTPEYRAKMEELLSDPETGTKYQSMPLLIPDANSPTGLRQVMGAFDNRNLSYVWNNPATGKIEALDPQQVIEGDMAKAVQTDVSETGDVKNTIKLGPRAGQSFMSSVVRSDGTEVKLGSPVGIGIDASNPFAIKQSPVTVPPELRSPKTKDELSTSLNNKEQAIRTFKELEPQITQIVGPMATLKNLSTQVAAFAPTENAQEFLSFLKTQQGAAAWDLAVREYVRGRALSPRFPLGEQERIIEELKVEPFKFFQNPEAAVIRVSEIIRTLQNDYEFDRAQLAGGEFYQLKPAPLGTKDDPFNMADRQSGEYLNYALTQEDAAEKLKDRYVFYPVNGVPDMLKPFAAKVNPTTGAAGEGYYFRIGDINFGEQ